MTGGGEVGVGVGALGGGGVAVGGGGGGGHSPEGQSQATLLPVLLSTRAYLLHLPVALSRSQQVEVQREAAKTKGGSQRKRKAKIETMIKDKIIFFINNYNTLLDNQG